MNAQNASIVVARHYTAHVPVRLEWEGEIITRNQLLDARTTPEYWLAPGLMDVQVNGFGGVDFQAENLTEADLTHAVHEIQAAGCTRFLLTLITDEWSRMMAKLRHLREVRAGSARLQHALAGWHIEGPFLSAEPGFHGAHDPALMRDPTPELIHELRTLTEDDLVLLTLAPERPGAIEAIKLATSLGIVVSLGHTNADGDTLSQALAAGATGFTHLGNGCPLMLDRADNILWRAFETRGPMFSVIPDRIHVSPPLFRLIHQVLPVESLIYVTDAVAAAGAPVGRYHLGQLEIEASPDGVVRSPEHLNLAGSALRPVEAVFRAAEMLNVPWQQAWHHYSTAPAEWLGLPCSLAAGQPADFCLLKVSPAGQLEELRVFVAGEEVAQGPSHLADCQRDEASSAA
jgi:N-acetylglucosamine-6-phosphate deacetylase